jgi:hypothetical protein
MTAFDQPPPLAQRIARYLLCFAVGLVGYAVLAVIVVSAYVLMQGGAFLVPMRWPTADFIMTIAAPILLAAFLPFMGVHLIASVFRMGVTPLGATTSGAAMGTLAAWAFCGRQRCFMPDGTLPMLGWYIVVLMALAALFYHLHVRARGL